MAGQKGGVLVSKAGAARGADEAPGSGAGCARTVHRGGHRLPPGPDPRRCDRGDDPGVVVERRWSPLRRVAAYVPGGLAAYPSTLVMTVVPARLAGVAEVVVASPAGPDGVMAPVLLAAASMLEVDELYAMGGAQAVAALAYGTETIGRVDKIVGPGNTVGDRGQAGMCSGSVPSIMPAGPSEVCVLADSDRRPEAGGDRPSLPGGARPRFARGAGHQPIQGWRIGSTPRSKRLLASARPERDPREGARRPRDGGDRRRPSPSGRLRRGVRRRAHHHPHHRPRDGLQGDNLCRIGVRRSLVARVGR